MPFFVDAYIGSLYHMSAQIYSVPRVIFQFHFCVNAFRFSCKCLRIILHISIACIVGLSMTVFGGLYVLVNAYFFFVFFFFSPKNAYIFYSIMCPDILNHNPSTQHFERLVLAMVFLIS